MTMPDHTAGATHDGPGPPRAGGLPTRRALWRPKWRFLLAALILTALLGGATRIGTKPKHGSATAMQPISLPGVTRGESPVVLPDYDTDPGLQRERLGRMVADQLVALRNVAPDRAAAAGVAFAASLKDVIKTSLTPEQFAAIATSLARRHFARVHPYPDITDLEIQANAAAWAEFIARYLAREPASAADQALLARQVCDLVATVRSDLNTGFGADVPASEIDNLVAYFEGLLRRDLNDPLMPVLKRPFQAEEMDALISQASQTIAEGIAQGRAQQQEGRPLTAGAAGGAMNVLHGAIWQLEYRTLVMDPEVLRQMRDERAALITKRSQEFDRLPEPQKAEEWDRRTEEEARHNQ